MSELLDILRKEIRMQGPISLARYMEMCLSHPKHGYYGNRDPLGVDGDFITSPEISQVFGELIGLWAAVVWQQIGEPKKIRLVELGPGRGTLMVDALRAANMLPSFFDSIELHLVESSKTLRKIQNKRLADYFPVWHDDDTTLPDGPMIVIANEFFDALPIRQFERREKGWHEKLVGLQDDGSLAYLLSPLMNVNELIAKSYRNVEPGTIVETCPAAINILSRIAEAIGCYGGGALIIDYGHEGSLVGNTFQAVKGHKYCSPLEWPGDTDLTSHVNFGQLIEAATSLTTNVYGPIKQSVFLQSLGARERAEALKMNANEAEREKIEIAIRRLIDDREMGKMFKALAISRSDMLPPPGFEIE